MTTNVIPKFVSTGTFTVNVGDGIGGPRWGLGDFNGDGLTDIALALVPGTAYSAKVATTPYPVLLLTQQSNNTLKYEGPTSLKFLLPAEISVADFNNDSIPDVLGVDSGQDSYADGKPANTGFISGGVPSLYFSKDKSFAIDKVSEAKASPFHDLTVGDINNDGWLDAFALSYGSYSHILLNDGKGNLEVRYDLLPNKVVNPELGTVKNIGGDPNKVHQFNFTSTTFIDANNDSYLDLLLLPTAQTPNIVLLLNDKTGNFSKSQEIKIDSGVGYGPNVADYSVLMGAWGGIYLDTVVVDINNDGLKDVVSLVTSHKVNQNQYSFYDGTRISVLVNNSNGFTNESSQRVSKFDHDNKGNYSHYDKINAFDINGDGFQDLLVTKTPEANNLSFPHTRFLINDGKGNFTDQTSDMNLPQGLYIPMMLDGNTGLVRLSLKKLSYDEKTDQHQVEMTVETFILPKPKAETAPVINTTEIQPEIIVTPPVTQTVTDPGTNILSNLDLSNLFGFNFDFNFNLNLDNNIHFVDNIDLKLIGVDPEYSVTDPWPKD